MISHHENQQLRLFDISSNLSDHPDHVEELIRGSKTFALEWIDSKHGSAQEFVMAMESKFGPKIRMYLIEIVEDLLKSRGLSQILRQYLEATLSYTQLKDALGEKPERHEEEKSSLDELFQRAIHLQSSSKYAEAIAFVSKLPKYSPYNNMLVYLQNPHATFWATAARWRKDFERTIKEDPRPMLILAPMTPVLMVYDVIDTEGKPLPEWFTDPFTVVGGFNQQVFARTEDNCLSHDAIKIVEKDLGLTHGGSAIRLDPNREAKIIIELKHGLERNSLYAILCHELAHIYLGHLGSDEDRWWPSRLNLNRHQREIEAESVAYIVCRRIGLLSHSAEYLAGYIKEPSDLSKISIDMVVRAAGRIESMGQKVLLRRTTKSAKG